MFTAKVGAGDRKNASMLEPLAIPKHAIVGRLGED